MFAIIQSGGKQYRVQEGDVVRLELLAAEPGDTVDLPVMMLAADSGTEGGASDIRVGTPLVDGANVRAEVVRHGRGNKIYIYKFKAKANYRRKTGHRQSYTEVRIKGITS
jgi:large subunit ribosomal protein L21